MMKVFVEIDIVEEYLYFQLVPIDLKIKPA